MGISFLAAQEALGFDNKLGQLNEVNEAGDEKKETGQWPKCTTKG